MGGVVKSWIAWTALTVVYATTLAIARVMRVLRRPDLRRTGVIAAVGSFHNPNWFRAHATPLVRSGVNEVIFVVDEEHAPLPGVAFAVPSVWSRRLFGRAISKFLTLLYVGWKHNPEVFIGYHIFPGAVTALAVARLMGRPACHQMTAGPIEVEGGGYRTENRLMCLLGSASPTVESLALAVTRETDAVVVRGKQAQRQMAAWGLGLRVHIVPGSIDPSRFPTGLKRDIDIVFVGRLTEIKRPDRFVQIIARIAAEWPVGRAVVVGDGPLRPELERLATELSVADRIEWLGQRDGVEEIICRARVYLLTSRSEGLSIALAEAMAAGAVPIVADVGELGDLVSDGETGYLISQDDIDVYAKRVMDVLRDRALWERLSLAARNAARRYNDVDAVAASWQALWQKLAESQAAPVSAARGENA